MVYLVNTKYRTKNTRKASNKENVIDYWQLKHDRNTTTQYMNQKFLDQTPNNNIKKRLEGGNFQKEIYYDCLPYDCEKDTAKEILQFRDLKQHQPNMTEVISKIKNPKEFKSALKQISLNLNMLYRSFHQAYSKAKKSCQSIPKAHNFKCENCFKFKGDENYEQFLRKTDCDDMNPLNIINVELPPKKQDNLEDVCYETQERDKHEKERTVLGKQEKHSYYIDSSCCNSDFTSNKCVCAICLEPLKNCISDNPNKPPVIGKNQSTTGTRTVIKLESDSTNWNPKDVTCLDKKDVCQQMGDKLKDLNYSERYAVFRGEMLEPFKLQNESSNISKQEIVSSQTYRPIKYFCRSFDAIKPAKEQIKQVLKISPICLTIPLKLQIDTQDCCSQFIESEIIMEVSSEKQQTTSSLVPSQVKQNSIQKNSDSDVFNSCISTSVIIKPQQTQSSLTEIFKITEKPVPISKGVPPHIPTNILSFETKVQHHQNVQTQQLPTKSTQSLTIISTPVPLAPALTPNFSIDNYVQTKAPPMPPKPQLVKEIRTTLQQKTPAANILALQERRHFSLPDIRPKEKADNSPPRYSLLTNYEAAPLNALRPQIITTNKPIIPPKPVRVKTNTAQTDITAINLGGHYKCNDMRREIQQELKELLQPNASKTKSMYSTDERDEILLDLHKLFHLEKTGYLPKELIRENALHDIRYIVDPELPASTVTQRPKTFESQESIKKGIKYVLYPKSIQKDKRNEKKYSKETKDKILEDLQIILKPRKQKPGAEDREIRTSVLHDLRYMLNTGEEKSSPVKFPQIQQEAAGTSRAQEIWQQCQQKPTNEIRDSVMADLSYMLDSTSQLQNENNPAHKRPTLDKSRKSPSNAPSKDSMMDN